VVIAGGHGQIALRLTALLTGRGDVVTGVVRNPDHRGDVEAAGGTALVRDLETADATDLAEHLVGADAVVFAAGAGPTSGAPRKDTVDRAAALLLADAAELAGVRRYVQVSAMGVDEGRTSAATSGWPYLRQTDAERRCARRRWTGRSCAPVTTTSPGVGRRCSPRPCPRAPSRGTTPRRARRTARLPGTVGQTLELDRGRRRRCCCRRDRPAALSRRRGRRTRRPRDTAAAGPGGGAA
jgi:hypothetical protein